ncbi:origin recognition complex subunit [Cordyceps javanica]|uniref:Origin recognition complex subunit n=1 Tax=Cordyceps javanica TaxID=43265 RepID=A0A545V1U7_9HYPO|nr:origin recognition complex subunit [Cordyceps javanica]TQW07095.1 origin recognition complex subunit [Cordyceps javanica]
MAVEDDKTNGTFNQEDHQVAYIFGATDSAATRPSKRRRVSKKGTKSNRSNDGSSLSALGSSLFVPLLNGAESAACVHERYRLYEESWAKVNNRIERILRDSNSATLEQVSSFVRQAEADCFDKIPTAFIVTGTNIASQDLLFEQLSETLQSGSGRFVRLRSTEAGSLKAVLKRIIRTGTSKATGDEEDTEAEEKEADGKRYLDYDLEALYAYVQTQNCDRIFVAFQDSEGFESSLLSDLITLLSSWRPRIPFTLLFGVATSVELLQARLLKSACRMIYGGQFDDVQTDTILESVFKGAVAASDVPLRLGAPLLRWMLDRQRDQVAGIQSFISSLKYAYMCHFFANPLSVLAHSGAENGELIQPEHLEAIRNTPSFRKHVEAAIESGSAENLQLARSLLEDDAALRERVDASILKRGAWMDERLRSLLLLEAAGAQHGAFSRAYVEAMGEGVAMSEHSNMVASVRRMGMNQLAVTMEKFVSLLRDGEPGLALGPYREQDGEQMLDQLETQLTALRALISRAEAEGVSVRSRYSGQSKVARTTVIAQRVQLSHHSATLNDEDRQFTDIIDAVTGLLATRNDETTPSGMFLSESWLYDARAPSKDVFVPRPRVVFERSLTRPHDYLACECCKPDHEGLQATLPATAILYQMYLETGNLINVADMWSSFYTLVSEQSGRVENESMEEEGDEEREREALVMFYRGLAELRALGYVKSSKKKTDHIAKVKWL